MLTMDSLEAAGGRFDEALGQMQKSVQTFAERVRVAHQKSDDDLRKASKEIARLEKTLSELQEKHDNLKAAAELVSSRIDSATVKVRGLLES